MTFNSIEYLLFFPITFILYWFVFNKTIKLQNFLILVASYIFYGWWDWRFLGLILLTSTVDFFMGIKISQETEKSKKFRWLCISWGLNLLNFFVFKYLGFFVNSFVDGFSLLGINLVRPTLHIILPIGISFYTLQSLAYTIDVYRGHLKPEKNYITFLSFVSFFPLLLAGPIERAPSLMPQFNKPRIFDFNIARDAMRQILWGMFKKVVIADNFAPYVNDIFGHYTEMSGLTLYFGWVLFSIQLYCDFAGYSDIAVGTGKLFGFNLMRNFKNPFFSPNPQDFWKRWHISLSSWFRDYVYMYMFGLKKAGTKVAIAMVITFTISGLWHGADWNFALWGFLNGLFIAIYLTAFKKYRKITFGDNHLIPPLKEFIMMAITYNFTAFTLVLFRAPGIDAALGYYHQFFTHTFDPIQWGKIIFVLPMTIFVLFEWVNRHKVHPLEDLKYNTFWRWIIYFGMTVCIVIEMGKPTQSFIYFQF